MSASQKELQHGDMVSTLTTGPHLVLWTARRDKQGRQTAVRVKRSPGKRGSFTLNTQSIKEIHHAQSN